MSNFGAEFLTHLAPPGNTLSYYDRSKPHDDQPPPQYPALKTPQTFLEAMSVREEVFVKEQKVPIENEYDVDDRRSHHWVTYASVSRPSRASAGSPSGELEPLDSTHKPSKEEERRRSQPTSSKLAVGTVRIVPPPHAPHPAPNSHHKIDNAEAPSVDRPTETTAPGSSLAQSHDKPYEVPGVGVIDPKEPFIKLGRLAILQPYRRLGMGRMLLEAALEWAGQHPKDVMPPPPTAADRERQADHYRQNSDPSVGSPSASAVGGTRDVDDWALNSNEVPYDHGPWKGLVLVHAQKHLERTYARWGFVRDESLGIWDEEGIDHIGMWRRVKHVQTRD